MTASPAWAELDARSNFSFLEGGSHPAELIEAAHALGLAAIGLADRNSVAGVVRAHEAACRLGLRFLPGARLAFADGGELILYPRDRAAWGRLTRLLSLGRSGIDDRGEADRSILKSDFRLGFADAATLGEGLVALVPAPAWPDAAFAQRLARWAAAWPEALHLAARPHFDGRDRARLAHLARLGEAAGAPMVATGGTLYHHPDRRALHDILTCIRDGVTIEAAGRRLEPHAERHLKPPAEMARLFAGHEAAIARALAIADACRFSLEELRYAYPREPVPAGSTPDRHLRRLAIAGARARFAGRVPASVVQALRKELRLIRQLGYAAYFLTVHDIVAWARAQGILCQGRGSAANSVTCFCLGITAVNPTEQELLFERFVSAERREPPDIDVDFEHERREEVIQHIYRRYGRHRAALAATVIHYRPRLAIREVGKAMGLSEDITARLAGTVWGSWGRGIEERHAAQSGVAVEDPRVAETLRLAGELVGFPRHLSQHVGGFVLTDGPLIELVPVHNAAMDGRSVIEWDKDDIDALGIMKVDVLALGMLSCIARAFALIARAYGPRLTLARVPRERPRVYDMLCRADSLGVFQVESRAQMNMLPRLRPRCFYDLVVEVAIVRPGPIQGDMVHPYLARRRMKREAEAAGRRFAIDFPAPAPEHGPPDELARVLGKTLGVPLFQEQAMRIAMEAAKFSGDEANGLRRAMATFRHVGTIGQYEALMVGRMIARGYPEAFARNCFAQIRGFGEYGFPESHAASFAHLVYVSAWLKCVFPEVFCAALLNSQPMGFYAPAQIVRDAREHGVEVRPVDVNASDWDSTLEPRPGRRRRAVRLGFRQITGLREAWAQALVAARAAGGPFASPEALRERAGLPAEAIELLAAADAFGSLGLARRPAQWVARGGRPAPAPLPLFAAAGVEEGDAGGGARLPAMPAPREVVADYETLRLSLKAHPMTFLRARAQAAGARTCAGIAAMRDGARAAALGVVLVRQRPGSARGVVFLTIEDETGIANIVVWPRSFERFRPIVMGARLLMVRGRVQRAADADPQVVHLVAERLEDWTPALAWLAGRAPGRGLLAEARSDCPAADRGRDPPPEGLGTVAAAAPGGGAVPAGAVRIGEGEAAQAGADRLPAQAGTDELPAQAGADGLPALARADGLPALAGADPPVAAGRRHPRELRVFPRSRDFH